MFTIEALDKVIAGNDERIRMINDEITRLQKYLDSSTISIQVADRNLTEEFKEAIKTTSDIIESAKKSFVDELITELGLPLRNIMIGMRDYALGRNLIDEDENVIDGSKSLEQVVREDCENNPENRAKLLQYIH